tara:strand:+ start:312 stop:839 length:528 start_codon:yes stop_codon:yes gene_type:complete
MYVAFLRGINVSGKNKIDMKALTKAFESLGFSQVKHYLNTGNLVFSDPSGQAESELEKVISEKIKQDFQLTIHVIVLSSKTFKHVFETYPFESEDGKNMYITLMKSEPQAGLVDFLEASKKPEDQYLIHKNTLYLYVPTGYGKSKLGNNTIEKKGGVVATTRNLNTLKKIQSMLN